MRAHRPIVAVLLWALAVAPAAADWDLAKLPDARATVIDEPVFGGEAWILEAGRGNPRSVVLVHGIGTDASESWKNVVPWLAQDHHVVLFDLPGFGLSTRANELYDPAHYAAFVDVVVERFVDGPFALVGHSMGGAVALRYAAEFGDDVERLVLVDVAGILHRVAYSTAVAQSGIGNLPGTWPFERRISRWIGDRILGTAGLARLTRSVEASAIADPEMRQRLFRGEPAAIAGYALLLDDFGPWIARVRAPTLILWGAKDSVAPLRTANVLAGNIAGARLTTIPGAGHTPMLGEPKRFREQLARFLAIPADALARENAPPWALDPSRSWDSSRSESCEGRRRKRVFEGEFDRITIERCKHVVLRRVRAHTVRVVDSNVEIENSVIRGPDAALYAEDSRLTVTAAHVEGEVAAILYESQLDVAGSTLVGRRAVLEVPERPDAKNLRVLFSVSRIESGSIEESVHGPRYVGPDRPLEATPDAAPGDPEPQAGKRPSG